MNTLWKKRFRKELPMWDYATEEEKEEVGYRDAPASRIA